MKRDPVIRLIAWTPERGKKRSWTHFLMRHWQVMAATDMFAVEVWSLAGLVRM